MVFSVGEIIDIVIMTVIVGFIFSGIFARPKTHHYDPLKEAKKGFNFDDFWFAVAVTAPAIILHELGHKFVAMGFGMNATFEAAYMFLGLGLILKLLNFPFLFFVPAYVSISGIGAPWMFSLIAFAGPFINLLLWLVPKYIIEKNLAKKQYFHYLALTSKVNMFLFIFNMIPIPGFDGSKVFMGIFNTFF